VPCFNPLPGWYSKTRNPSGKRSIVFTLSQGMPDRPVTVPCSQCIGCRLAHSRMWATRLVHETQLHENSLFLTLTYRDDALPPGGSLVKEDFQLFMGRLRDRVGYGKLRCFWAGEYGEKLQRPHYHAIIYGLWPEDRKLLRRRGPIYTSKVFEETWPHGFHGFGAVTFESAAYVARYVCKKVKGRLASAHYGTKLPEFAEPSRRPGIGRAWIEKYWSEVYPADQVVMRGFPQRPPKYYDRWLEKNQPEVWRQVRTARRVLSKEHEFEDPRLRVRELVAEAKIKNLVRELERVT